MSNKINTRIQLKHDIEANWLKAVNFTPMQGEIIIYDIEIDADGNVLTLPEGRITPYTYERMKIGDGKTNVNDLLFVGEDKQEKFYIQDSEPTDAMMGSIWIDTSVVSTVNAEEVSF